MKIITSTSDIMRACDYVSPIIKPGEHLQNCYLFRCPTIPDHFAMDILGWSDNMFAIGTFQGEVIDGSPGTGFSILREYLDDWLSQVPHNVTLEINFDGETISLSIPDLSDMDISWSSQDPTQCPYWNIPTPLDI